MEKQARGLGLRGFVRNEPDGHVYAEVEGEESAINQLAEWCKKGPELAIVKRVEVVEGELKIFKTFEIIR